MGKIIISLQKERKTLIKDEENKEAVRANQKMDEKIKDYGYRASSVVNSEVEEANQNIQDDFYGKEENNFLPFHIDANNPPVKK